MKPPAYHGSRICRCEICHRHETVDEHTGRPVRGVLMSHNAYREHRRSLPNLPPEECPSAAKNGSTVPQQGPSSAHEPCLPAIPPHDHAASGADPVHALPPPLSQSSTTYEEDASAQLDLIHETLAKKRTYAKDHVRGLIFLDNPGCLPAVSPSGFGEAMPEPTASNIPFVLKYTAPMNSTLILYEQWLLQMMLDIERYAPYNRASEKLRQAVLLTDLKDALSELDGWVEEEWERQGVNRHIYPIGSAENSTHFHVDTGMSSVKYGKRCF